MVNCLPLKTNESSSLRPISSLPIGDEGDIIKKLSFPNVTFAPIPILTK